MENLAAGDLARTASGALRPVKWIGRRQLDLKRRPAPANVWPVRIGAGAFGDNLPVRDLCVSPGHNLLVDDVLIPAIALVNGATIVQETWEKVTYWHVELDSHDILLAEGLPAESYLDCGNRAAFANGAVAIELFPDFAPKRAEETCAPIEKTGPRVARAKTALLERALSLGHALTDDPRLRLIADGMEIAPLSRRGQVWDFDVPAVAGELRLTSRVWSPGQVEPESADDRRLGVLVTALEVDGRAFDLAALNSGWRALEGAAAAPCRWTDGSGLLPLGARRIRVTLGGRPLYWEETADAAARLFGFAG